MILQIPASSELLRKQTLFSKSEIQDKFFLKKKKYRKIWHFSYFVNP